jgi:hypothetical protein
MKRSSLNLVQLASTRKFEIACVIVRGASNTSCIAACPTPWSREGRRGSVGDEKSAFKRGNAEESAPAPSRISGGPS